MNCLKKQLLIISFALIVAIAIFLIFGSSIYINQIFFIINAFLGIFGLVSTLISEALTPPNNAYTCCGNLATLGSSGLILISLLAIIIEAYAYTSVISLILAGSFFFLVLMLGGIWCYLNLRNHCHRNYYC